MAKIPLMSGGSVEIASSKFENVAQLRDSISQSLGCLPAEVTLVHGTCILQDERTIDSEYLSQISVVFDYRWQLLRQQMQTLSRVESLLTVDLDLDLDDLETGVGWKLNAWETGLELKLDAYKAELLKLLELMDALSCFPCNCVACANCGKLKPPPEWNEKPCKSKTSKNVLAEGLEAFIAGMREFEEGLDDPRLQTHGSRHSCARCHMHFMLTYPVYAEYVDDRCDCRDFEDVERQ